MVRTFACRTLEARGYRILAADSGPAALALAASEPAPIDLLVTDVAMPGMGGPDLARRLAADRPNVRTLYISAFADLRAGGPEPPGPDAPFLSRPFSCDQLATSVRGVLDGSPVLSSAAETSSSADE